MILVFFLIFSLVFSNGLNIDLIFSLQENFHSNVILLPKEIRNEKTIKKLSEYQKSQPKAFIGLLDLNDYKSIISPAFSRYLNKLIIFDNKSDFIKKLFKAQKIDPRIITSFIWIYFIKKGEEAQNLEFLNIPFDSKFFIVKEINISIFEITDVYQITLNSPKIYSRYAVWENQGLKLMQGNIFLNRKNLQGYEMKIAGAYRDRTYKIFPYWHLLSDSMNFTLKETWMSDTGHSFRNGTKTGIKKLIYEKIADGSFNFAAISTQNLNDFDFIAMRTRRNILYVEVKHGLNWKAFIMPFEIKIWISIIIWVIVAYVLMLTTNHIFQFRLDNPIFSFISALCNQGRSIREERFSLSIAALMPYILAIVLLQHYSADLLTHLTVKDSTPPFRNLKGVIDDGSYEISILYPSFTWAKISDYIKAEARETIKLVQKDIVKSFSGYFFHDLCTYRRVLVLISYNGNRRVNCNIVELPEVLDLLTIGLIVQKDYPYRKMITIMIKNFYAYGLSKIKYKYVVKEWDSDITNKPIELEVVSPAFLILLSFICLSVIILLFEIIIWKFKKKRSRNRINQTSVY